MNDFIFNPNKKYVIHKNTKIELDPRASLVDWWIYRGELVTPSRHRRLSISDDLGISVRLVLLALMDYLYSSPLRKNRIVQSDLRSILKHKKRQYSDFLRPLIRERTYFSMKMEAQYKGFFDNDIKEDIEKKINDRMEMLNKILREDIPLFQHSLDVLTGSFIDYHYIAKTSVKVIFPNRDEKMRRKVRNTYNIKPRDSLHSLYLIFTKHKTIF